MQLLQRLDLDAEGVARILQIAGELDDGRARLDDRADADGKPHRTGQLAGRAFHFIDGFALHGHALLGGLLRVGDHLLLLRGVRLGDGFEILAELAGVEPEAGHDAGVHRAHCFPRFLSALACSFLARA
jgi:hypothetical protein